MRNQFSTIHKIYGIFGGVTHNQCEQKGLGNKFAYQSRPNICWFLDQIEKCHFFVKTTVATFWVPIGKNGILFSSKSCYTDCSRQSDQHFEGTNAVKRFGHFWFDAFQQLQVSWRYRCKNLFCNCFVPYFKLNKLFCKKSWRYRYQVRHRGRF